MKHKDTYDATKWLRENKDRFKGVVHEPIMLCVSTLSVSDYSSPSPSNNLQVNNGSLQTTTLYSPETTPPENAQAQQSNYMYNELSHMKNIKLT